MSVITSRLVECESVIERGMETFVEVGNALAEIRNDRLYKESHATFEDYCRERWQMSRPQAYRFISAAQTVEAAVSPMGDKPKTERVARELGPLQGQPEELQAAWTEAVEKNGSSPTAQQVREVVDRHVPTPRTKRNPTLCPTCGQPISRRDS